MENKNKETFVEKKYREFFEKNGYVPKIFNPYNCSEISDYAPTLTTKCGSATTTSTVLISVKLE